MTRLLSFLRWVNLITVTLIRNVKWVFILLFVARERAWDVLDFKMYLYPRKAGLDPFTRNIHKQLILGKNREEKSTQIMQRFIERGDVILELGANIGYYVLVEARVIGKNGYIYAVEPEPKNFELLKKNIALNNAKGIEVFNLAISDKRGTARLYMAKASNLHSLISRSGAGDIASIEVKTDTVDNFLEGKRPVTFLRMDIEGYETELVEGMRKTLQSAHLRRMFIEIHPHKVTADKMQSFLASIQNYGFELAYCVSRDTFERSVLRQTKVERLSLAELREDERLTKKKIGLMLFFQK